MTKRPVRYPTPKRLLALAIEASGMPATTFATSELKRNERTIRRWLVGGKIPKEVLDWLKALHDERVAK